MRRRRTALALVGLAVGVLLAAGAFWFEPWRLFTSSRVEEDLPGLADAEAADADAPASGDGRGGGEPEPEITELAAGDFVDAEHGTTGEARVLELADGSRYVRLESLDTSDGPDLVVALSEAPSGGEWGSYDDDRLVDLGDLKATEGDQNYVLPADVDLDGIRSVVIWCDRFDVAFGTAPVAL